METVLYQFALCPYCNKVRAGLELKGIPFQTVEVSPRSKAELPPMPEDAPRKVPVLKAGDKVVWDSTAILAFLDEGYPDTVAFSPTDAEEKSKVEALQRWVDDAMIQSLPTVLYGTWREAAQASKLIAKHGRYRAPGGLMVKLGGPIIMHAVAKRILKKHGRSDAHAWVHENLDYFEAQLGAQDFACGDKLTVADVAMHGALTCVEAFPIFQSVRDRPRLMAWFERVEAMKPKPAVH